MTIEQIRQFRKELRSIVYQKSQIDESNKRLKQLHFWDKNGSHNNAILKELEVKSSLQHNFKEMLKGIEYDQWINLGKSLSKLISKLTKSTKQKEETEKLINDIKFKPITQNIES